MKIAIISDIHGNMAYLERAKKIIEEEKITLVVCCGDVQTEEAFNELNSWKGNVYLALGNADYALKDKLASGIIYPEKMEIFNDFGVVNINGTKIAFCHYDFFARKLAENGKYDIVFYGHTHTPWEEKIGKTRLINPGEITAQFGKPTFAIYDTVEQKAKLKLLN
jgi:hypothetical protein